VSRLAAVWTLRLLAGPAPLLVVATPAAGCNWWPGRRTPRLIH